jgi:hypothetical protein
MPSRLYLTADTPSFDSILLSHWKSEGFNVTYLPFDETKPKGTYVPSPRAFQVALPVPDPDHSSLTPQQS